MKASFSPTHPTSASKGQYFLDDQRMAKSFKCALPVNRFLDLVGKRELGVAHTSL